VERSIEACRRGGPPGLASVDQNLASRGYKLLTDDDKRADECNATFGMDFENCTVGRLIEGRSNYQRDHAAFRAVLAEIRGRVWELGWRADAFAEVDRRIRDESWRRDDQPERIERYGKKYGWIAYYEAAGALAASGLLRESHLDPATADCRPRPVVSRSAGTGGVDH
jgi:hypothetical protein